MKLLDLYDEFVSIELMSHHLQKDLMEVGGVTFRSRSGKSWRGFSFDLE
jgi:hypothetical protein